MCAPMICAVSFALLEDIVTEFTADDVLSELLCAGDIVLMGETIEGLGISSYDGKRLLTAMV